MRVKVLWIHSPQKDRQRRIVACEGLEMETCDEGVKIGATIIVPWNNVQEIEILPEVQEKPAKRKPGRPRKVDGAKQAKPRAKTGRAGRASAKRSSPEAD